MRDKNKTKDQLIEELTELRQQIAELEQAKNEETGERSEEYLQEIIDGVKDGIVILDLMGTVTTINKRVTEVAGYTEKEIIGKRLTRLKMFPPKSIATMFTAFTHVVSGQQTPPYEVEVYSKTGEKLVIEIHGSLLRKGGKKAGVVAVLRDVTERKQLEALLLRERETFVTILQHAPYGVVLLDKEGKHLYVNHAFTAITGYTLEDIPTGRDWLHKAYPDEAYRQKITALWKEDRGLGGTSREISVACKNGEMKEIEFKTTILDDGRAVVMLTDVTERKRAEDALQRHQENLEALVTERTAALQATNAQLQQEITERKEAEEKLKESEERFRNVFEMAQDLIYIKDRDLKFTAVNPAMERYFGVSASEIIGKKTTALLGRKVGLRSREEDGRVLNGEIIDTEHSFQVQGNTVIQNVVKVPMRNSAGEIIGLCGTARDITESKKAEEALQDSEERLKILFEFAPDGYYVNDLKGTFIDGNRAAEEITGYKREELIGKNFLQLSLLPKNQIPRAAALLAKNALGKTTGPDELTLNRKDGSQVALEIRTYPIKIHGQTLVLGIARDITERKQKEDALRDSEERFRRLIETTKVGVSAIDEKGVIIYANERLGNMWGYPMSEIIRHSSHDFLDEENLKILKEQLAKRKKGEHESYEITWTRKDGSKVPTILSPTPIFDTDGRFKGSYSFITDITERKQMEEALWERQQELQALMDASPVAISWADLEGNIQYINRKHHELFGYTLEEISTIDEWRRRADQDPTQRESFTNWREDLIEAHKRGRSLPPREMTVTCKDGSVRYVVVEGALVSNRSLVIYNDITERKQMEEALRESESRFRLLVEHSIDNFILHDFDGKIMDVNQYSCDSLGYTREELLGLSVQDIDSRVVVDKHQEKWKKMVPGKPLTLEGVQRRKDGTIFPVEVRLVAFESGGRRLILGIARDISERKRMEETLRESEEKYRELINGMNDTAWVIDFDGKFIDANDAAVKVLGYSRKELLSMGPHDIDFSLDAKKITGLIKRMRKDKLQVFETAHTTKDGKTIPVEIKSSLVTYQGKQAILSIARDTTERKRAEEALRDSEARYRAIVEAFDGFVYVCSQDYRIEFMNKQLLDHTGYDGTGELCYKVLHNLDSICPWCVNKQVFAGETVRWEVQNPKDNHWYYVVNTPLYHADGSMSKQSMILDITERKKAEEALRESESRFRLLVEHSKDGVVLHDLNGKIIDVNQHTCDSLGYTREEMLGRSVQDLDYKVITEKHKEKWRQMVSGEPITLEGVHKRKDGTSFPVEIRLVAFDSGGRKLILALVRDITERKRAEETIRKLAYHDALTGLPNRVLFTDRLNRAMARANRSKKKFVVMSLDLDHFKDVNDTHGHGVGDQLLSSVGKRLIELLRKEDTVSRMGGDEFFLLLPEVARVQDAAMIAQKVLKAFHEPFVLDDQELRITTSIGVAMYPDDGEDVTNLLRNADVALYQAKQKGRNNYQHYTQTMNPESQADE